MEISSPLLTISQILIFITVVEEKGFLKAGSRLHMTQSAVSKTISRLEKELGFKLFIRSTRFLKLTPAGETLYKNWIKLIADYQCSYEKALRLSEKQDQLLKIGLLNTADPDKYFNDFYQDFLSAHPEITCEIHMQYMTDLARELEQGVYDIILLPDFTRFYLERQHLEWCYFASDNAQLLMSAKHPLAEKKKLKTADILDLKFVTVGTFMEDSEYLKDLTLRLKPFNKKPKVVDVYKTAHDIKYLFRPGDAVLLVDSYFDLPENKNEFVIRPVTDQKNGVICAWNPKNRNTAVDMFLNMLQKSGGKGE